MKRNLPTYPIIKRIKPRIFWHDCNFCNIEFKKEVGFKIEDRKACYALGEDPIMTYYCCSNCAKDEEEVLKLINRRKENFINNRPSLPGAK